MNTLDTTLPGGLHRESIRGLPCDELNYVMRNANGPRSYGTWYSHHCFCSIIDKFRQLSQDEKTALLKILSEVKE